MTATVGTPLPHATRDNIHHHGHVDRYHHHALNPQGDLAHLEGSALDAARLQNIHLLGTNLHLPTRLKLDSGTETQCQVE